MTDPETDATAAFARLGSEPHRRYNALLDEWILVSAGRTTRPWLGRREAAPPENLPAHDPECYLCPGNPRANGQHNPSYAETFVFVNDFSALHPETPTERVEDGLLRAEGEAGECRVLCFSPRHDLALARMDHDEVRRVVDVWARETDELGRRFPWVQVFENRGPIMGASNPHPHGQVWAGSALPRDATREDASQARHWTATGRRLLLDYAVQESGGPRVVEESDEWLVVVPFWATWPYETIVVRRAPAGRLCDLDDAARHSLAAILRRLLARYDNLFELPFPYSMGWHQAPFNVGPVDHWQLHGHFLPPLLQANVRKFMVGYELLAEAQRDLTPEMAAAELRAVSPTHHRADASSNGPTGPTSNPSVSTATG